MSNGYAGIVARRIIKMIDESDTCEFPPIFRLAERLKVSRATAAKAARILRDEGVLSKGSGRGNTIVKAKNISAKKQVVRPDHLAAIKIREYIKTAEARERIIIPVMELTKNLGYPHRTVCNALRMLVKEGLLEKYGKYYAIAREQE